MIVLFICFFSLSYFLLLSMMLFVLWSVRSMEQSEDFSMQIALSPKRDPMPYVHIHA
jgi:hypothetical protein